MGASGNGGGPERAGGGKGPSVAIVGGGFGGVGAAVMLVRAGYTNVTIFERGDRVGGVWAHNTYPGAACDVPSHLYEFSFEPNPRWSRRYAKQAEIQEYIEAVAARHGVLELTRTGTEVTRAQWDEDAGRWQLQTSAGAFEADILLTACGQLSIPKKPRSRVSTASRAPRSTPPSGITPSSSPASASRSSAPGAVRFRRSRRSSRPRAR